MTFEAQSPILDRLLADLTEPQAAAVRHAEGPLLVLAGAGAGKTRVITRRAAYLAATVARSHEILAITFTNKAAEEMRQRLGSLGEQMTVCTFHSLCARLLRIHGERAGISKDFTVFDTSDQRRVMKQAVIDVGLSVSNWSPAKMQSSISRAKNAMVTAEQFADDAHDWSMTSIARIYQAYEAALAAQHGLDFDDLLMKMALLLRDDEDLRRTIEDRYRFVLIDEYQDTNLAQYEIARLITQERGNLCATGDPDQSIYGWRGADINNILRFEQDYPNAVVVKLERNYRSTKRILSAASSVIASNVHRKDKTLWTENKEGSRVRVVTCEDGEQEARFIADEIAQRLQSGGSGDEVAVCYRINALSRALEEAFIRAGIAYQIARGTEFYNRKEIKDVLAYARVLINRYDETALTRIINTPTRGIGATTIKRMQAVAVDRQMPLMDVIVNANRVESMGKAAVKKVGQFADMLGKLEPLVDGPPRESLAQIISQSGMRADLVATAEHDPDPLANVDELVSAAAAFESAQENSTLRDWLQYTSLLGDVDSISEGGGAVTLMTFHAAKGLEFPAIYVIGLEDGMLPFRRGDDDFDTDEEEERRLLFVGMTRAKRELTLMHSRFRMIRGRSERKVRSGFIGELPQDEVQWLTAEGDEQDAPHGRGAGELPDDIEQWQRGTLVRHPQHDLGQISWMRQSGRQITIGVQFRDGAERTFILGFEQLVRVDFDEVGEF